MALVVDRDRHAVETALAELTEKASRLRQKGERVEAIFYYSGHADDDGLLLGSESLPWNALRHEIQASAADVKVVVLDACSSGAAVKTKGGRRGPPILVDQRTAPRGSVFLTSSSADEASQESSTLGGSFFTHALVSGLRGAADVTGDGRVTLDEAYRFAFQETLARTETSVGGAQHANFDIQLTGAGELVLTDLRDPSGRLVLGNDVHGRVFVRDSGERRLMAEVTKLKGQTLPLALPPGGYDVVVVEGAKAGRATARVTSLGVFVDEGAFTPVDLEEAVPRGLLSLTRFPINLAFLSPLEINSYAPRVENNLSVAVVFGRADRVNGVALAGGGNFIDERLIGGAMGLGFNGVSGPVSGALLGAANLALSDLDGVMGGVFFNLGTARTNGAAWAAANVHTNLHGAQLGLVNVGGSVVGAQVGLVNIADTVVGTQVGVVNIANSVTAPVGVFSLVRDGQASVGLTASDLSLFGVEARAGGRYLGSFLRAGGSPLLINDKPQFTSVVSAGLVGTIPITEIHLGVVDVDVDVDVDVGVGAIGTNPFASVGARLRLAPLPFLHLSVGPELRLLDGRGLRTQPWALGVGDDLMLWPGLVVGVGL